TSCPRGVTVYAARRPRQCLLPPERSCPVRSYALRSLILLVVSAWIPAGLVAPHAYASVHSGAWQVLGAARTLPTLYRPAGLALDARGDLYVADSGNFPVVE